MIDKKRRTLVKTIIWRIIATFITMVGLYVVTGNLNLAVGTGLILNFIKAIAYYVHERAWENIKWGRIF